MSSSRWRRAAACYLALFFLAVAAAPHHHLNGLEDILLDQPSDSGIIVQPGGSADPDGRPAVVPLRLIQDVPCLACFTRDFVCSPAAAIALVAVLAPLPVRPKPLPLPTPELLPAETASRAPPRVS